MGSTDDLLAQAPPRVQQALFRMAYKWVMIVTFISLPGLHAKGMTGLALPPLNLPSGSQYAGSWASANSLVFLDLMKHSGPLTGGSRNRGSNNTWGYLSGGSVTMRSDGYPQEFSPPSWQEWSMSAKIGVGAAFYTAGAYVVLYDGQGILTLEGDATSALMTQAGRMTVQLSPSAAGLTVRITATNASDPLHNVRIVPDTFEANFTQQVFTPAFLALVQGFPLLRFAAWQRTSGNTGSAQLAPRDWAQRTTPASITQVRDYDGVCVEHCVALANAANASMWISLPRAVNASDQYANNTLAYIASNLASHLLLFVEYGTDGPGWITSHQTSNTVLLAAIARQQWAAAGRSNGTLVVVANAPISGAVPYILNNLGAQPTGSVDAVALAASFGSDAFWPWVLDDPAAYENPSYFSTVDRGNLTVDVVLQQLRVSLIAADVSYNGWYQKLTAAGLAVLGYAGGPSLMGPLYGARANADNVARACSGGTGPWPCVMTTFFPPWALSGTSANVTWADAAAWNATVATLAPNATREAALESLLRQARNHPLVKDLVLDGLWRWHQQMGGSHVVLDLARLARACSDAPGVRSGHGPDECADSSLIVATPASSPTYQAALAWNAAGGAGADGGGGANGSYPKTSADWSASPSLPVTCLPACVYGDCVNGACVCWGGVNGTGCDAFDGRAPALCNARVGINLEGISYYSRSWSFVDAFKGSSDWIAQSFVDSAWDTKKNINLVNSTATTAGPTARGYPAFLAPAQRVSSLMLRDLAGHAPGGTYVVLYDGTGLLNFATWDVQSLVSIEAGRIVMVAKPSTNFNNGILITIERTDPSDPIRNIRVLMPGYEAAAAAGRPFHPDFLDFLRPFGMLRFMDWMQTNSDTLPVDWDERPLVTDRSWGSSHGGVPVEVMVQLANTLGADAWFNMPHTASDDYVRQFARLAKQLLRPDLKVYVEYSNEVWGTGFPGGQYAQQMGLAMGAGEQGNLWYGGATNEARLCFVAWRTANISQIWKDEWPDTTDRVVIVISGQSAWPITSSKLLSCHDAHLHVDALATAPYFGQYDPATDINLAVFLNTTLPGEITASRAQYWAVHAAIAANYSMPLVAYEAGQSLTGNGTSNDMAILANRDPAMADVYDSYLAALQSTNFSRVTLFSSIGSYSKYGSWGLLEAQDEDRRDAPKYKAVMQYINSTATCSLPLPSDPTTCPGPGCNGNGDCLSGGSCACYSGYSGVDCGTAQYTEVYSCGYQCTFGQGYCNVSTVHRTTRTWSCQCKAGFAGLTCSIVSCPDNCNWNGDCIDQGICACYPGFNGPNCSRDCGCRGHGRCDGNGACLCDVGWRLGAQGTCEWDCAGCSGGSSNSSAIGSGSSGSGDNSTTSTAVCVGAGECGCAAGTCAYGTCFSGTCQCWAGYGGLACNETATQGMMAAGRGVPRMNVGTDVGMNLAGLSYWSTEWVWVDVMKGGSGWLAANADDTSLENAWNTGVGLALRPDGYPWYLPNGTIAHKLLQRDVQLHTTPGRYVCLFDGNGTLDFGFDAQVISRAKGRVEFLFTPTANLACAATGAAYCGDNGIHLKLLATSPADPVRNVRVLMPAFEVTASRAPFHPWFLKSLARYNVLRFMDWQNTNSDHNHTWGSRTTPAHDTQARPAGAAVEHIVALCNTLGASPWLNVHHTMDDAYVTQLATLVRDTLRPDVVVYVEHSNEVWNPLFPQNLYAQQQGLARNLSASPTTAAYRYHAARTAAVAETFRSVFAAVGAASRVKVVLGGWSLICNGGTGCGAAVMNETLGWNATVSKVDYLGVTGYWDCGLGASGPADMQLSVQQMLAKCTNSLNATRNATRALVAAAGRYGVPLITYEAGPSLVEASAMASGGTTNGLAAKYAAVARDAAMYGLYRSYLQMYAEEGLVGPGRPWMHFSSTGVPSRYGTWGALEYTGQDASLAPKYRALMDWIDGKAVAAATAAANLSANVNASVSANSGPFLRPTCLTYGSTGRVGGTSGAMWLSDGLLAGRPAVTVPTAGQVLVQGGTYDLSWSTVGWPSGPSRPLTLSLWRGTDCDDTGSNSSSSASSEAWRWASRPPLQPAKALLLLASNVSLYPAGKVQLTVPAWLDGTGLFLRIEDGVMANYSDVFSVRPAAVGLDASLPCPNATFTSAATPPLNTSALATPLEPPALPLSCSDYPGWNIVRGERICDIDPASGCRSYRTARDGSWPSSFKPVLDCTAQYSPWPRADSTAANTTSPPLSNATKPPPQQATSPPFQQAMPPSNAPPLSNTTTPPPSNATNPPQQAMPPSNGSPPFNATSPPPNNAMKPPPQQAMPPSNAPPLSNTTLPPPSNATNSPPQQAMPPLNGSPPFNANSPPPNNATKPPPQQAMPPSNAPPLSNTTLPPPSNATNSPPQQAMPPLNGSPPFNATSPPPNNATKPPPQQVMPPSNAPPLSNATSSPPSNATNSPPQQAMPPSNASPSSNTTSPPPSNATKPPPQQATSPPSQQAMPPFNAPPVSNTTTPPPKDALKSPPQQAMPPFIAPPSFNTNKPSPSGTLNSPPQQAMPPLNMPPAFNTTPPKAGSPPPTLLSPPAAIPPPANSSPLSPPPKQSSPPPKQSAPPPQQSSPPPQQSSPPPTLSSPPPQQSSPPPKQSSPPPKQSSPPPQQSSPPLKQSSPPPQQSSPPPKQSSPPPQQSSPPPQQSAPPPKQSSPPPQQSSPPPKQSSPPPQQLSPPPKQSSPPPQQSLPPPKQSSPPPQQSSPPPKQSSPPPQQSLPPLKQSSPPPQQSSPPPKQSSPPPKQSSPPPKQSSPPPQQSSPLPKQQISPPPTRTSTPLKQSLPPPKQTSPPPKQSLPLPKQSSPPPKLSSPPPKRSPPPLKASPPPNSLSPPPKTSSSTASPPPKAISPPKSSPPAANFAVQGSLSVTTSSTTASLSTAQRNGILASIAQTANTSQDNIVLNVTSNSTGNSTAPNSTGSTRRRMFVLTQAAGGLGANGGGEGRQHGSNTAATTVQGGSARLWDGGARRRRAVLQTATTASGGPPSTATAAPSLPAMMTLTVAFIITGFASPAAATTAAALLSAAGSSGSLAAAVHESAAGLTTATLLNVVIVDTGGNVVTVPPPPAAAGAAVSPPPPPAGGTAPTDTGSSIDSALVYGLALGLGIPALLGAAVAGFWLWRRKMAPPAGRGKVNRSFSDAHRARGVAEDEAAASDAAASVAGAEEHSAGTPRRGSTTSSQGRYQPPAAW